MIFLRNVPQSWQKDYLGALIAVAHTDGDFDVTERELLLKALDHLNLHERVDRHVRSCLFHPPDLETCVRGLASASDDLRFSLIVHMLDVALADGVLAVEEQRAMIRAADLLGVNEEQVQALLFFVSRAERFRSTSTPMIDRSREVDTCIPVLRAAELPEALIPLLGDLVFDTRQAVGDGEYSNKELNELLEKSKERARVLRMRTLVTELCEKSA